VAGKSWRLAPLNPSETVAVPIKSGVKPMVVWTIQP
jgi:hypothetical protein